MTRRRLIGTLAGLAALGVLASGCLQIVKLVKVDLGTLSAVNGAATAGKYVDLASESSTYKDNKGKFSDVADVAVLGTFKNNLATPVSAQVWIVQQPASPALLTDLASVQAAGGVMVWSLALGANETKSLTWDNAAALFTAQGKQALKNELEGDAIFTLYVFGNTGTYDITATNAAVAVMIDVNPVGGP